MENMRQLVLAAPGVPHTILSGDPEKELEDARQRWRAMCMQTHDELMSLAQKMKKARDIVPLLATPLHLTNLSSDLVASDRALCTEDSIHTLDAHVRSAIDQRVENIWREAQCASNFLELFSYDVARIDVFRIQPLGVWPFRHVDEGPPTDHLSWLAENKRDLQCIATLGVFTDGTPRLAVKLSEFSVIDAQRNRNPSMQPAEVCFAVEWYEEQSLSTMLIQADESFDSVYKMDILVPSPSPDHQRLIDFVPVVRGNGAPGRVQRPVSLRYLTLQLATHFEERQGNELLAQSQLQFLHQMGAAHLQETPGLLDFVRFHNEDFRLCFVDLGSGEDAVLGDKTLLVSLLRADEAGEEPHVRLSVVIKEMED